MVQQSRQLDGSVNEENAIVHSRYSSVYRHFCAPWQKVRLGFLARINKLVAEQWGI